MSTNLIAISGLKGSGKDCAAEMFQYCLSVNKIFRQYWIYRTFGKIFPKKWKKIAFADQLKKSLSEILCIPVEKFNDRNFKENYYLNIKDLTISEASEAKFSKLSDNKFTKLVKDLDPSISDYSLSIRQVMQAYGTEWCQQLFGKNVWINSTLNHATGFTIISDLRFKAEEEAVHKSNGIVIFIDRPEIAFGNHASEREMLELLLDLKYDKIIYNDGTIKDLFNSIKSYINDI